MRDTEATPEINDKISEKGKNIELDIGNIGRRIEYFLTIMDTPNTQSYRTMESLTIFDLREIEKLFGDGVDTVSYGILRVSSTEFQKIKGTFQKHRFEYAKTLWFGSNEAQISGLKSKYALSEMRESNRIHREILGTELISPEELQEMENQINY